MKFQDILRIRSRLIFEVESFFQVRDYIGVHTPSLSSWLIPERHIDVYETKDPRRFLVPSPEIYLKQLLSTFELGSLEALPNVYEISHSFRRGDANSPIHDEEFLMLECYTPCAILEDSLNLTRELLLTMMMFMELESGKHKLPLWTDHIDSPYVISMKDAFDECAKISLTDLIACSTAKEAMDFIGYSQRDATGYDWEDVFHLVLVDKVEPHLPQDRPVFLTKYPSRVQSLARECMSDSRWSDRWELYIAGKEIANCYVEETNSEKIQNYMEDQNRIMNFKTNQRENGIPYNTEFLQQNKLPPYSGIAFGIDRLLLCFFSELVKDVSSLRQISSLSYFQSKK